MYGLKTEPPNGVVGQFFDPVPQVDNKIYSYWWGKTEGKIICFFIYCDFFNMVCMIFFYHIICVIFRSKITIFLESCPDVFPTVRQKENLTICSFFWKYECIIASMVYYVILCAFEPSKRKVSAQLCII